LDEFRNIAVNKPPRGRGTFGTNKTVYVSGCDDMCTYEEVEAQLHSFLISIPGPSGYRGAEVSLHLRLEGAWTRNLHERGYYSQEFLPLSLTRFELRSYSLELSHCRLLNELSPGAIVVVKNGCW
jgi:hypothetical protein